MKKRIERMGRIKAAIKPMYCVPKRSDLSLIGSAFEAAGFRCVRIRTECSEAMLVKLLMRLHLHLKISSDLPAILYAGLLKYLVLREMHSLRFML